MMIKLRTAIVFEGFIGLSLSFRFGNLMNTALIMNYSEAL